MATLNSSRLFGLIDRLLHGSHHRGQGCDVPSTSTVQALRAAYAFTGDQIDHIWLQRAELRSVRQAADALDGMGFRSRLGCLTSLFVDEGCGLICAENLGPANLTDSDGAVRRVLDLASGYHADGVILATNDLSSALSQSSSLRDFTMKLYRKGQAIGVPLLDHLILSREGWESMFSHRQDEQR